MRHPMWLIIHLEPLKNPIKQQLKQNAAMSETIKLEKESNLAKDDTHGSIKKEHSDLNPGELTKQLESQVLNEINRPSGCYFNITLGLWGQSDPLCQRVPQVPLWKRPSCMSLTGELTWAVEHAKSSSWWTSRWLGIFIWAKHHNCSFRKHAEQKLSSSQRHFASSVGKFFFLLLVLTEGPGFATVGQRPVLCIFAKYK